MLLNRENYFSKDAGIEYMSVSQFKSLTPAFGGCEAAGVAQILGLYEPEKSTAFLEGSYVHAWQEGKLDEFKANNPDLYSGRGATAGQLKSNFQHCNKMIEVLESDPLVMDALSGEKEVILTAELFGLQWKIMIDSYSPKRNFFADLKALKGIYDKFWNISSQCYENVFEHYGYGTQMAVYAEIEKRAKNRNEWLFPHLVVVTKEDPPDHEIILFDYEEIQRNLNIVEKHIERVKLVKNGEVEPEMCGKCPYCRSVKKLDRIKSISEFRLY